MLRLSGVLFVVVGCTGTPPNANLADLPGLRVSVTAFLDPDTNDDALRPTFLEIGLAYDIDAFRTEHADECATLDTVRGSFAGTSLAFARSGATDEDGSCLSPSLEGHLELGLAGGGHLDVSDASHAVYADFSPGALAARIATLKSHADWKFAGGDTIVVDWSHPADLADRPLTDITMVFHRDDARGFEIVPDSIANGQLQFQIPSPAPVSGHGSVTIGVGNAGDALDAGDAATCAGADSCRWAAVKWYEHVADVD